uniref:Fatty acyl-CoA reductase n=2 Tax=Clastoptera arizonana TaxID=38151 RepID=A0A1B6DEA6_9HEMI
MEQNWSDIEKKFILLNGDVSELNLGLSAEDEQNIIKNVSIVFHVAASVRFDDPLSDAIKMNTRGTREIVQLCLKIKSLKTFLHVSTTYSNCYKSMVEEKVYPPLADWREMIETVEKLDPGIINILTKKYIGSMPNTYTFSKSLAENVVWEHRNQLPVIILRPSIVISSWKDPFPGWLDTINGPTAMLVGGGKGVLRTCLANKDVVADYMPVDVAIRAIITAVWHHCVNRVQDQNKIVYNCSSRDKSVSMQELMRLGLKTAEQFPFSEVLWTPTAHFTTNKTCFAVNAWFKHLIPALIVDLVLKIRNKKPRLVKIQQRIFQAITALSYFTLNHWTFKNENFQNLDAVLLPEDKIDFSIDLSDINIKEYFVNATLGLRQYLLHEDDSKLAETRKQANRLYWLDKILKALGLVLLLWSCQIFFLSSYLNA